MLRQLRAFVLGESYWKIIFKNNHELSELETKTVTLDMLLDQAEIIRWDLERRDVKPPITMAGKQIRVRRTEWLEDLIASGDLKNVREVMLVTPKGTAHITVTEPYTAFQFSRGTFAMLTGERIKNLQIIGTVIDRETGECECAVWDVQAQQLYVNTLWDAEMRTARVGLNNVKSFKAWREGVVPIGRLNIEALDLRGIPA